jgi:DNA end-binding protein Ku
MPHAIWTGSINFGLVTIPVKLLPAVRADENVHFHYLHAKDKGRITNVRRCESCGKDVPWKDVVRGFEYKKSEYAVVTDGELKALRPEATQSVAIQAFVDRSEIDPMLFDTPYYLEPEKSGRHAYALLRDSLAKSGRVGIAQVVLRTRAHLAALSPRGNGLVIELLHYAHELIPPKEIDLPPGNEKANPGELKAAEMLINAMVKPFDASEYADDYEDKLRATLEKRAKEGGGRTRLPKARAPKATNVVDLVEVLRRSLAEKPTELARGTLRKAGSARGGGRHKARPARRAS